MLAVALAYFQQCRAWLKRRRALLLSLIDWPIWTGWLTHKKLLHFATPRAPSRDYLNEEDDFEIVNGKKVLKVGGTLRVRTQFMDIVQRQR
jgi:hypothetical protein